MLVLPLGMVVAGGGVVVDTGEGVVVDAGNVKIVRSLTMELEIIIIRSTHQRSNLW